MKVQLVANLAANGELVLAQHANAYEAPAEVSGMGMTVAMECGNVIMGSVTYQMFAPIMQDVFAKLKVVVLSSKDFGEGVYSAKTAEEAVRYLEQEGFEKACVLGGTKTYNAFLEAGLADDLFFNLFPVVIGGGGALETAHDKTLNYKLVDAKKQEDIMMLHFSKA